MPNNTTTTTTTNLWNGRAGGGTKTGVVGHITNTTTKAGNRVCYFYTPKNWRGQQIHCQLSLDAQKHYILTLSLDKIGNDDQIRNNHKRQSWIDLQSLYNQIGVMKTDKLAQPLNAKIVKQTERLLVADLTECIAKK